MKRMMTMSLKSWMYVWFLLCGYSKIMSGCRCFQDDFMNQAAAEVESDQEDEEDDEDHVEFGGEGFDLDAHIAKLISNAEKQDVGSLRAAGKPIRTIKRKNNAGTESHPRFYKIDESDEDGSQDERGEDDFEEDDMEEDEDRDDEDVNRSRRPLNPMDNAFQRVMMAEYADENIGELDPDDPRVRGTGFHASTLERAMNEFLEMGISDSDDEELLEGARAKARRRKQAGTTACRSDDSDGEDEDSDEHAEDEEEEDEVIGAVFMLIVARPRYTCLSFVNMRSLAG
jgi:hypothetical protein